MKPLFVLLVCTVVLWPALVNWVGWGVAGAAERAAADFAAWERARAASPTAPQLPPSAHAEPQAAFERFALEPQPAETSKRSLKRRSQVATQQSTTRAPLQGIRVRAQTVLRLANAGVVPAGKYTPAAAGNPAGMLLSDVSQFGVGLQDGDILTEVAGQPARSRSAVVSAVLQARAAKAPAVSAVFWRQGTPWQLWVEMPYVRGS